MKAKAAASHANRERTRALREQLVCAAGAARAICDDDDDANGGADRRPFAPPSVLRSVGGALLLASAPASQTGTGRGRRMVDDDDSSGEDGSWHSDDEDASGGSVAALPADFSAGSVAARRVSTSPRASSPVRIPWFARPPAFAGSDAASPLPHLPASPTDAAMSAGLWLHVPASPVSVSSPRPPQRPHMSSDIAPQSGPTARTPVRAPSVDLRGDRSRGPVVLRLPVFDDTSRGHCPTSTSTDADRSPTRPGPLPAVRGRVGIGW
eukprot:TRINITY_DN55718_c0_g1_i1.p1 TRINITY_DN55718_c0_g1~~TRINITY_DN55718_c0_g1_i1.p1  ORF type:complete len:287 (-),score=40.56 TRINITY_DN55718_c0_g1_i1:780-1577(-)